jgi:hypothetical protein
MMAQAMRDPLYFASVAIANQDAPESGDLCIRCHAPDGWLNGRSTPTDGSALNNNDYQGVQCDFCHKLVKPYRLGGNPFSDDAPYTQDTWPSDQEYLAKLTHIPPQSGNGMYVAHDANAKRGPFVDAAAKHKMFYSPFHSESDICGTCHDVSNPAFTMDENGNYVPNALDTPAESFDTYKLFPVERTYSEWKMSAYNTDQGVDSDVFTVYNADGSIASNRVRTCQDCHMRDVAGYGANKRRIPYRHNLPLHDMTGGNTFVPGLVAQLYPGEVDEQALLEGVERARFMLQNAATLTVKTTGPEGAYTGATVTIENETGHKLPSGYPEGRRMWIHLKAYNGEHVVFESGHYNEDTGDLTKTDDLKIYEVKLAMSQAVMDATGKSNAADGSSFHFVLNNEVIKDNRIPPRGFTNAKFEAIQSPPVDYTYADGAHSDVTVYEFPEADKIEVELLYQTTSKEYVTFLRDENVTNDAGEIMFNLWNTNGKSAPVVMESAVYPEDGGGGDPPQEISIAVENITFDRVVTTSKGGKTQLTALVSVVDDISTPIEGALVSGQFSGPTNNSVSGVTDSNGEVIFTASAKKASELWCLDITNIELEGYSFTGQVQYCETESAGRIEPGMDEVTIFPNPGWDMQHIALRLRENSDVSVKVFTFYGALVRLVHDGTLEAGKTVLNWNTSNLAPGNYIVEIIMDDRKETRIIHIR